MRNRLETLILPFYILSASIFPTQIDAQEWNIVLGEQAQHDEAVRVAVEDLLEAGNRCGFKFHLHDDQRFPNGNSIIVGDATRNKQTAVLSEQLGPHGVEHEQGYEIITRSMDGRKTMIVAGGSLLGDVYGLYWILDRIRVFHSIPDINVQKTPALETRISLAWGRRGSDGATKEEMRNALRYGLNWVSGPAILDLTPWSSEPENTANAKNRERARDLIAYAHSLHLNYFSFANEFTYHPTLLEEFDATLSPCDPAFQKALQAKLRRLFKALPELDGIELCNDDISGFWDNYRGFDIMHDAPECDWPLEKRFRTFVKNVHEVVVDEFDKTYFHFTWSLNPYEQHNQPSVFRKIFTEDVPVKNLFLIPKITSNDRWWHQPYNPTFNQTAHQTVVGFETMNYYESGQSGIFPTFAGAYYQAGLQTLLSRQPNNLRGSGYRAAPRTDGWDTASVTAYLLARLSWGPDEDIRQIARDFCAIHFGAEAAEQMAEIYLMSPNAYKYGLHIEPVSYGQFNSLVHMRVGTFPAQGYPHIDGGKEHIEFLRQIYLRCKPWLEETFDDLDHGLAKASEMTGKFEAVRASIRSTELAQKVANALTMTRLLIHVNNLYVQTAFAYFAYREQPTPERQNLLQDLDQELRHKRKEFTNTPGFGYRLFGVDQLLRNVEWMLEDRQEAEMRLAQTPDRNGIEKAVNIQQQGFRKVLTEHADEVVQFLNFEGEIDGQDILWIKGDKWGIDHLRWDGPDIRKCELIGTLPREPVTIIPRDIESRPMHPFILEQPSAKNDFRVQVYLCDVPGGKGVTRFELYYIRKSPKELGITAPWISDQ